MVKAKRSSSKRSNGSSTNRNTSPRKKSTVSFHESPRVEKIPNPKSQKQKQQNEPPEATAVQKITSYVPEEETSLPELSQAVIQKKMGKMLHLLDTRPLNYVCVTDRRNRYVTD